jgi:hypothetical protein
VALLAASKVGDRMHVLAIAMGPGLSAEAALGVVQHARAAAVGSSRARIAARCSAEGAGLVVYRTAADDGVVD